MTRKLTDKETVDIINAYTVDLEPMISIAHRYDRTRQAIWKTLHRNGINPDEYGTMKVSCECCQTEMERPRCQVRDRKHIFCSQLCYYAWLEASQHGKYSYWRHGQRIARAKITEVFDLQPGHIVHHLDRNCYNNMLSNLMVFANQGDHCRYHRLGPDSVTPLWGGSSD